MLESLFRRIHWIVETTWGLIQLQRGIVGRAIYFGLAGCLLAAGSASRFALPLVPIADLDLAGYLSPALSKLNHGVFTHVSGLNFLYPGSLFIILKIFRDFRAIVIVQHLLGVLAGGLFLLIWNRLYDFCPKWRMRRAVYQGIGLVGAGILLLSNRPILLELRIRPDAVCIFFQLLVLWLTLQCVYGWLVLGRPGRTVGYGCAAVASAWLLASLKPSFLLFALLTIVGVCWVTLGVPDLRARLVFGAAATAIVLAITLPERFLQRSDPTGKRYLTETLFAVHAKLIRVQIETDLRSGGTEAYSAGWLQRADQELGEEIAHTHKMFPLLFPSLGFQPDYLMNGSDVLFSRWARELGGEDELLKFLRYYYGRALFHRPLAFAREVVSQMSTFYADPCPAFSKYKNLPLAPKFYRETQAVVVATAMLHPLSAQGFGANYQARINSLTSARILVRESATICSLSVLLGRGYRLVCLIGSVVALWLIVQRRRRHEKVYAPLSAIVLCLPNLTNTFSLAFVHTMDTARYSQVQFGAALLAELWILCWLLDLGLPLLDRGTSWMRVKSAAFLRGCLA